jgi:paraquat-inducible protein B
MHRSLQNADKLMERLDGVLAKEGQEFLAEARRTLASADRVLKPDSPLSQDARDAMREIARAAQSLRVFLDYLERHPEAILSGKKASNANPEAAAGTENKK